MENAKEIEILLLRHQLAVLRRHTPRPRISRIDRAVIAALARLLPASRRHGFLLAPATILRWHRQLVSVWVPGSVRRSLSQRVRCRRPRHSRPAARLVQARAGGPGAGREIQTLPAVVRPSLTWDQGPEMRDWKQVAIATDIGYSSATRTSWAGNENTNGLLRQYFPKGSDLSLHSEAELDQVAAELNDGPQKRLGYRKPIEEIGHLFAA